MGHRLSKITTRTGDRGETGLGDGSRVSLSSDLCGTCHGEPARHGRFQQWQLSRHANYELAVEEGTNGTCAKCHSGNGFVAWAKGGFSNANVKIECRVPGEPLVRAGRATGRATLRP